MEELTRYLVPALIVAGFAVLIFRLLPLILRRAMPSPFIDGATLEKQAAKLRSELEAESGRLSDRKRGELYEKLGSVMAGLSIYSLGDAKLKQTIDAYRQSAEAYRAAGKNAKSGDAEINLALHSYALGARTVDSVRLRDGDRILSKYLATENGKWPYAVPREFCEASRAFALALLAERLGDRKLLLEALPLCARSRKPAGGGAFKPPMAAADGIAGDALAVIGRMTASREILTDAVAAARRALDAKDDKTDPIISSAARHNYGHTLQMLGEFDQDREMLEEAVRELEAAPNGIDRARWPGFEAMIEHVRGRALTSLGKLTKDQAVLARALSAHRDALAALGGKAGPFVRAESMQALGEAKLAMAELRADRKMADDAAESLRTAEDILKTGDLAGTLKQVRYSLAAAERLARG